MAWMVMVALAGCVAAGLAQVRIDTGVDSFLPSADPTFKAVAKKAASFGGDPVLVLLEADEPNVLLQGKNLERMLAVEGELARQADVAAVYGPATALNQTAASAQNLLASISGHRERLSAAAVDRARRDGASRSGVKAAADEAVAQFDRRYATLLLSGLPAGLPTLHNPKFVNTVLRTPSGLIKSQWKSVVPNDHAVVILVRPNDGLDQSAAARLTEAVRNSINHFGIAGARVTVTGAPVVTSALADRARSEFPVLGIVSVLAVGAVFFVVPWTARRRARLRPLVAALVGAAITLSCFGWLQHPLSLGVVAFLPVLLGIGSDFPYYLSQPRHRRAALVGAAAAMAGFGALTLSPLPFVREFGLALAFGMGASVAVSWAMRHFFGAVPSLRTPETSSPHRAPVLSLGLRLVALGAAFAIAASGWASLAGLSIESRTDQLAKGLPELQDVQRAEDILGFSGEVSLVLRGPDVLSPEAFRWSLAVERLTATRYGHRLRSVVSVTGLLQFLGSDPSASQIESGVKVLPTYLTSAVIDRERQTSVATFGVGLLELDDQRSLFAEVLRSLPDPPAGYRVELVGLPVAGVRGLDLISERRDLINVAGLALASLVVAIGLWRRGDAMRVLAATLLSIGWVLGLVAVTTGSLSPLTVAVGSLTTATSCEFAVMMAAKARRGERRPWLNVGTAALAGSVGYLVLALSDVAVLRNFGLLLAGSVACSYLGALLVLWALPTAPSPPGPESRAFQPETL